MKIYKKKGNKHENDILYSVTMEKEAFSIIKFCVLNNYLAKNEYILSKEAIDKTGKFFFLMAMQEAMVMGRNGIDFREWLNNKNNFDEWCKKYKFPISRKNKMWEEISKEIQITLEGFNGNN